MDEFELVFFDFGFGDGAGGCWGWDDVVIDIICRVIFSSFSVLFIFFAIVVFIL